MSDPQPWRPLLRVVLAALFIRLVVMVFVYPARLDPDRDHFGFGYEASRIARSIVLGDGYSSPMPLPSGPTAWVAPVYPLLEAGVFEIFGIYSPASAIAMLVLQDLFSAFTCVPVFFIGERTFGRIVGIRAAWFWAFFPYAIYVCNHWIWETSLTTLLLTLLLLVTLRLEDSGRAGEWLGYGLLWALAALTSPVVLSVLPFLFWWLWHRRQLRGEKTVRLMAAAILVFGLSVAPWFIRNWQTFGQFVYFRSNFASVMRMGNGEDSSRPRMDALNPSESREEGARFCEIGELPYLAEKKLEVHQFIRTHPVKFAWLTLGRIVHTWTEIWIPAPSYLIRSGWPAARILSALYCVVLTTLAMRGFLRARRHQLPATSLYLIMLVFFPLMYYVTWSAIRFRHPIDPEIALLAVYGLKKKQ